MSFAPRGRAGPPARRGARGSALRWRRAVGLDIPALSAFLRRGEASRVGFSGRLLQRSASGAARVRLPSPLRGAVWVMDGEDDAAGDEGIIGAVLCHSSRLVFPIFPDGAPGGREADEAGIGLLVHSFSPASIIGMAADVGRYEAVLGLSPDTSIAYRMMSRAEDAPPPASSPPHAGLTIRRATGADLDALLPLQEGYEREEVLTRIHSFNQAACTASLSRALERQIVYVAEEAGVIVAKAGTNARGFAVDQIGGVYTLPARRGRGLGHALMAALLAEVGEAGRVPALFVKPSNAPARALYRSLGFVDIGDYRADYFEI